MLIWTFLLAQERSIDSEFATCSLSRCFYLYSIHVFGVACKNLLPAKSNSQRA